MTLSIASDPSYSRRGLFGVRCQVSGGVTGTRTGWLKAGRDSAISTFTTAAAAQLAADGLNERNKPPASALHGSTVFRYWVEAFP